MPSHQQRCSTVSARRLRLATVESTSAWATASSVSTSSPTPGTVNHICIGVDNYDPDQLAAKCKQMGITATVNRDPNSRTSGGDQLYIQAFDNHRLQVGPHGYQG